MFAPNGVVRQCANEHPKPALLQRNLPLAYLFPQGRKFPVQYETPRHTQPRQCSGKLRPTKSPTHGARQQVARHKADPSSQPTRFSHDGH